MTNTEKYFKTINSALKNHQRAIPCLLVDLDKLDKNIKILKSDLNPDTTFRVVVKSLPSFELISYVMKKMNTHKLMVFHQPFLTDLSLKLDRRADILWGKPMPVKTAQYYYDNLPKQLKNFDPYRQIQWLADTESRILQYIALAERLGKRLRLNLEIDVGLHRGGFSDFKQLRQALELLKIHAEKVEFSGFMGYDPHIVKIPSFIRSKKRSLEISSNFYRQCKSIVEEEFPELWNKTLTFNGAGSPTINFHSKIVSPLNDIAAGSCLVMPTTFDIPSLEAYSPACFIATPVLKKFSGTNLPGLEKLKPLLNFVYPGKRQSFFIYGGNWKADFYYPAKISQNKIFGASSNQTMINASETSILEIDDFVFLRPQQSEFVFLQFGELLLIRNHKLAGSWTLLKNY
ncbi:alanine racemase [Maribellus maritimus]|uniref:alanine racemase n=1 Tax=Maribellus maritimus TaxID=2870838 RepID=UPI001EE9FD6B|nr:alanine racemase [Maribellus maritimus]MCG6189561.1 alanine racemase [Maribellus maritimus]